jgi:phospholipase A1/A2
MKILRIHKVLSRTIVLLSCTVIVCTDKLYGQSNQEIIFLKKQQTLAERWELERKFHKGLFVITPYKPVFVTAGRWSSNPNEQPYSENPNYSATRSINYNKYEAKFQFSLKTKVIYGMFKGKADLWIAYTQKAHWQIYNPAISRPFRELNYEPEIILNIPVHFSIAGISAKMVGLSFNHQSNGRTLPLSRSWNRIIGHIAFEKKQWYLMIRGWYRIPDEEDENPKIADYIGRGEGLFVYNLNKHQFSLQVASGLRPAYLGRGSFLLSWIFPVVNNLRAQVQYGGGYGETIVDYNHHQTILGISISLIDW